MYVLSVIKAELLADRLIEIFAYHAVKQGLNILATGIVLVPDLMEHMQIILPIFESHETQIELLVRALLLTALHEYQHHL